MLLSVCLQPVLQACDLPSVGKGGLACSIVGYPKHKAGLRNNGRGGSSYFGRRTGLFVKVIQQVAGPKEGWHTIWELVCFYRCSQIRRAPRGFPGTSHVRPEAPLLVTSQGSKRTRIGQSKTSLSVLSKKGFFRKGKQVPNLL